MSKYSETILTANGLDLATRAANGKVKFTLTKAAATSDDLSKLEESDLQNLTTLPNEKQTGVITNQDENIPNSTAVVGTEILFTNEGINEGYSINGVGLYAKEEGKDEEILYAVNTAVEPEFMPDFADKVIMQFKITMYVIVGRTENVTVIVDPTGMASKEWVTTKIAEIDVNDKIQDSDIDDQLQKRLVYTNFKSKNMNKATQIAEMVGQLPTGLKTVDKEGNITPILPDDDGLISIGKITGGSDDGDEDPDHPSAGIDYYAGSLENGEITDRHILLQKPTSPTIKTNVKFMDDVGLTMNRVGTGLQFMIYLQRTTITKGVIGTVTKIPLNYDPKNNAKNGYYTTTAPVPMYTKAESYEVDKSNTITLDGVGEELGLSNHKAPGLTLTFKSDKTMDVEPIQGYDNDGDDGGVTGFTYDIVVELISSYNVQTAVQQLPVGIDVFNGAITGEVALTAVNDFFTNVSGLEITLDENLYLKFISGFFDFGTNSYFKMNAFDIPTHFEIDRKKLVEGFKLNLTNRVTKPKGSMQTARIGSSIEHTFFFNSVSLGNTYLYIGSKTITPELEVFFEMTDGNNTHIYKVLGTVKVINVKILKEGNE